jgi:hypothetical protein
MLDAFVTATSQLRWLIPGGSFKAGARQFPHAGSYWFVRRPGIRWGTARSQPCESLIWTRSRGCEWLLFDGGRAEKCWRIPRRFW